MSAPLRSLVEMARRVETLDHSAAEDGRRRSHGIAVLLSCFRLCCSDALHPTSVVAGRGRGRRHLGDCSNAFQRATALGVIGDQARNAQPVSGAGAFFPDPAFRDHARARNQPRTTSDGSRKWDHGSDQTANRCNGHGLQSARFTVSCEHGRDWVNLVLSFWRLHFADESQFIDRVFEASCSLTLPGN